MMLLPYHTADRKVATANQTQTQSTNVMIRIIAVQTRRKDLACLSMSTLGSQPPNRLQPDPWS